MIITRRKALFIPLAPAIIGLARPSVAQLLTTGAGKKPGGAGGGETWDPTKSNSDAVFSSGNLVIGNSLVGANYWAMALASPGRSTGKYSFEAQVAAYDGSSNYDFITGLVADPGAGNYIYPANNSDGAAFESDGTAFRHSTSAGVSQYMAMSAVNDYWHWDVDLDAGKMWCFVVTSGHTSYDNGGNPATGANPSTTFTPPLTLFPAGAVGKTSTINKLKLLTGGAMLSPIPSGFTSW